uniref:Uncharacterized protein n=1 Tax=Dicentrarchus labrax TaxID=13489 RepID=A0A8C4IFU7_DICLA
MVLSSSPSSSPIFPPPFLSSHPALPYLPPFVLASCCFGGCEWKVCGSGPPQSSAGTNALIVSNSTSSYADFKHFWKEFQSSTISWFNKSEVTFFIVR